MAILQHVGIIMSVCNPHVARESHQFLGVFYCNRAGVYYWSY